MIRPVNSSCLPLLTMTSVIQTKSLSITTNDCQSFIFKENPYFCSQSRSPFLLSTISLSSSAANKPQKSEQNFLNKSTGTDVILTKSTEISHKGSGEVTRRISRSLSSVSRRLDMLALMDFRYSVIMAKCLRLVRLMATTWLLL